MSDWGADPLKRVSFVASKLYGAKGSTPADTIDSISASKENVRIYTGEGKMCCILLGLVDINRNKNSYYKMQLPESVEHEQKYFVVTGWVRIGTSFGDYKLEEFLDIKGTF